MATIIISILAAVVVACLAWVLYAKSREENFTREKYAFRCLAATVSLVALAVAAITSKQGVMDHVTRLVSLTTGRPLPATEPASMSEQILIALLAAFAIYMIFKSHRNWTGLISADEANKRRLQRPINLVPQALDESARILRRAPEREIHQSTSRLRGEVPEPSARPLVWHEHARELFELWFGNARFERSDSSWDGQMQSWIGLHTKIGFHTKPDEPVFLFCRQQEPDAPDLAAIADYVSERAEGPKAHVYIVHRGQTDKQIFESPRHITCLSESFLLDNLVDFTDYYYEIARRVNTDCFPNSTNTVRDIYVPSSLTDRHGQPVSDDLGQTLEAWAVSPPGRQLTILGDYGQGKSTGALMFAYETISTKFSKTGGRVPILLELRGKSPANLQPQELLGSWSQQFKIHAQALMTLLIAGRLILIFEGFDEMANVSRPEDRLAHFRALWQFSYPQSKILFTGRPNLFFEDRELDIVFKTSEGAGASTTCEVLRLAPFTLKKIEASLRWVNATIRNQLTQAARSSEQIFDIVSRPSLLYIVATLWSELRPLLASGGITSAHVIDRFIIHSYQRQAEKEQKLGFMALTTSERRYFHEGLAVFIASKGTTNQITGSEMDAMIKRLYDAYPTDDHVLDQIAMESNVLPLKRRLNDPETAIDRISTDVRTHGVLVQDLEKRGAFRFAHKSFYELLFAKSYAYEQLAAEPVFYNAVRAAMDGKMGSIEQSGQVVRFYGEVLVGKILSARGDAISLANAVLDVVSGSVLGPAPLKWIWLRAQLLTIRIMPARKSLAWYVTMLILAIVPFLALLASRALFGEPRPVSLARVGALEWVSLCGLFVIAALTQAMVFVNQRAERVCRLWAAVLLSADAARGYTKATAELSRLVGSRAAMRLIHAAADRWPILLRKVGGSRVLWVDDNPANDNYERQALEALWIECVISTSTDDALTKIEHQHFDAIISDMGRPPDAQAGYTLLDKLRSSGNQIPFIIYAGSRSPEHQAEARRRGALGCTNRATELSEMVVSALQR